MSEPTGTTTGAEPAVARTPEQIEAEIEATRTSLAGRLDTLQQRLSPASLAGAVRDRAMRVVQREDGALDPVRAGAAAAIALVVVLYLIRRRRL